MSFHSPVLSRVQRGGLCTGCGLCTTVVAPGRLSMEMSAKGFLRPRQHHALSAAEEKTIETVCPGLRLQRDVGDAPVHPVWGPLVGTHIGWASDRQLRHHASSGGALSAVLTYLLESGAVDYVLQVRASPDSPIRNAVTASRNRHDVYQAAGSRYAPSAPLQDFRSWLEQPGRFAFVGKPCDVAALRALAAREPGIREKIPYALSFFCAGVPSELGTRRILEELQLAEDALESFRFRGDGWPGTAGGRTRDGRERSMSYARSWGGILSNHLQFRCKICPDGSGGFADVVFGDAWYGDDDGYPLFDEQDGRSLVLARTPLGARLVREAHEAGYLGLQSLEVGEIAKMQPYQARRTQLVVSRLLALALLGRPIPRFRGFQLCRAARLAGLWPNLKSFLGTARRVLLGRA